MKLGLDRFRVSSGAMKSASHSYEEGYGILLQDPWGLLVSLQAFAKLAAAAIRAEWQHSTGMEYSGHFIEKAHRLTIVTSRMIR